jgi:hypothetical protein
MTATREDVQLLLQTDQALKPGLAAKKFVWTDVVEDGEGFFDRYGWDSDERFHINEVATYFETCGLLWKMGLIDQGILFEWVPAELYWRRVGPVLLEARRVLDSPELWHNFEALARAQEEEEPAH